MDKTPKLVKAGEAADDVELKIVKPVNFLDKFKSKRASNIAGVETLLTALPIIKIGDAGDFVRLHPDEDFILVRRTLLRVGSHQGREA